MSFAELPVPFRKSIPHEEDKGRTRAMAKLYFSYSTMNAGKSTMLMQASYNYQERGMRTVILIAAFDDRAGIGRVSSRSSFTPIAWPTP